MMTTVESSRMFTWVTTELRILLLAGAENFGVMLAGKAGNKSS